MSEFRTFTWKDSNFRIRCSRFDAVTAEIVAQRGLLERYIARHPEFLTSLTPVALLTDAPEIATRMARAASVVGVGPMAAVAGAIAQIAAESAIAAGAELAVVDNGGDLFLISPETITVGLFAGADNPVAGNLALRVTPDCMPLAVCSSSSRMGHSHSFGDCDLATVVSRDAATADASATFACNLVRVPDDIEPALERVAGIPGVDGVLIVKGSSVGLKGNLPALVRNRDAVAVSKITRDRDSSGPSTPGRRTTR